MANKAISELPQAQNVQNQDLFVLEQSGIAKKLAAETFITEQGIIDALASALDGHGGIQSVALSSVSGRIRTYLITFSDGSATTFQVYDGTSIDHISKTSTAGLVDTYTVFMSDGATTFFQVTNGSKGDTGYPTDEQVTTAVNTWLNNNVAQETGYVLDRTLTMSNAAAPADLVGDLDSALSSIDADQLNFVNVSGGNLFNPDDIVSGKYVSNSGTIIDGTGVAYSGYIPVAEGDVIKFTPWGNGAQTCQLYDANKAWKRDTRWIQTTVDDHLEVTVPSGCYYATISFNTASISSVVFVKNQAYNASYGGTYGWTITPKTGYALSTPEITELNSLKLEFKNLVGMDANVFYPVNIPSGAYLAFSTYDGSTLGTSTELLFYDENKVLVHSVGYNGSLSSRVVQVNVTAYFLKWRVTPAKNVQIEIVESSTSAPTEYEAYLLQIKNNDFVDELCSIQKNTFISDYNTSSYQTYADAVNAKIVASSGNTEQFLFFSDPHLALQSGNTFGFETETETFINFMEAVYNASPMSFCLCGGDWLGNNDSPAVAVSKLTFADGFMRKKFNNYLPIVGNHDTNYQGTEQLDNAILMNCYQKFREEQKMYYKYSAPNSTFYIFDTGTENEALSTYQNTQVAWFASNLLSDNSAHIVIALHMVFYNTSTSEEPITTEILKIAQAYNARTSITFNGTTYDYSSAAGKVSFCIGGHQHQDGSGTLYSIPYVLTTNATDDDTPTFDLCVADWSNNVLNMVRVGSGSDRTITIL